MPKKPNVILIGIDTLRADHLGVYGYKRKTSPNIDAFAGESAVFWNCFSQSPVTAPSFMSIFTSRYPLYHGIVDNFTRLAHGRGYVADDKVPTLAEILKDNGYRTGAFTGGVLVSPSLGFSRGFEYYATSGGLHHIPADEIFYWLKEAGQNNFFLFLHTYAVHNPWFAPRKYWDRFDVGYHGKLRLENNFLGRRFIRNMKDNKRGPYLTYISMADPSVPDEMEYLKSNYDGAIQYVDDFFGDLLGYLRELQLLENSIIIFTADHGDEFGEHGKVGHKQLYDELLHIPLIIKFPGREPATSDRIVRSIDIFPTILAELGIKIKSPIHGVPLNSLSRIPLGLPAISDTETYGRSIRDEKYKYIFPRNKKKAVRIDELYDLEDDPREMSNIGLQNLDLVQEKIGALEHELHHRIVLPVAKKTVIYLTHSKGPGRRPV